MDGTAQTVKRANWQAQLDQTFPARKTEPRDYSAIANRYLQEILRQSSSPVAILIWAPKVSDLQWGGLLVADRLLEAKQKLNRRTMQIYALGEKRRNAIDQKISHTGHVALLWESTDIENGYGYASFWPDPMACNREKVGRFETFIHDLNKEEKLPDLIKANLDRRSGAEFLGRVILEWDTQVLGDAFSNYCASPPIFDLKSRKGTNSF